jgi:hypothetical protein
MNRGDRRETIFEDDKDRGRLLETLTGEESFGGRRTRGGYRQVRKEEV